MGQDGHQRLKKELEKRHMCYVLITCDEPADDGKMVVEMTYGGDAVVASYLLQDAQSYIEKECEDHQCSCKKQISQSR